MPLKHTGNPSPEMKGQPQSLLPAGLVAFWPFAPEHCPYPYAARFTPSLQEQLSPFSYT
jgi:hypothetical protein